jgi:chromosome segregation ATPase
MPTKPPNAPGSPAGDFWAKSGVWIALAALAVALVATWLSGIFSTNGRIDAIYPTILQQTKDIGSIASDLHVVGEKIAAAQASLTAAVAQNADLAQRLVDLQEKQAAMLARQEDQAANVQEIKKAVNDLSANVSSRFDQLQGKLEKINSPSPIRKTEFLEGSYVFGSSELSEKYRSQLKDFGVEAVTTLNFNEPDAIKA